MRNLTCNKYDCLTSVSKSFSEVKNERTLPFSNQKTNPKINLFTRNRKVQKREEMSANL